MAPLPLGRIVAQIVVPVIAVLARAIPAAYAQAVQNAKRNGVDAATKQGAGFMAIRRMAKDEALMILNLSEKEATNIKAIQERYDKYFAANSVEKGGSFYLQSKVYRAKELLDEFIKEKHMEDKGER